jgi:catechol 2,3-dioxygenase-like lactoylglutathione lyase family enzyme
MTETTATATNLAQVATVMVPVADQVEAIAFYVGMLGLE